MIVEQEPVRMTLVGIDGNAFSILGAFKKNAKRQGWPAKDIDAVIDEATSGDYDNLLRVIISHVEEPEDAW